MFLRGFWINPLRFPDFGWAWLTRFLINTCNALVLLYLLYYLQDVVRVENPAVSVLSATAIYLVAMLGTVLLAGMWSDRVSRRRVFVCAGGAVMAAAAFLVAG